MAQLACDLPGVVNWASGLVSSDRPGGALTAEQVNRMPSASVILNWARDEAA